MKIAFLGAGKMATAICYGLIQKGVCAIDDILAADKKENARASFEANTGVACAADIAAVIASAETLVLAVKPQDAASALGPVRDTPGDKLVISICAGLSLDRLCGWTGSLRVIRVMPNTPAMVNRGAAAFACAAGVGDADRELANRILGAVGIACEVPESHLDAVTGLSGSGPAYVFEFIQALVDAGVAEGLDPDVALQLVAQTVAGAAEMLKQEMGTPDELRRAVTSPGGTTEAGLGILEAADFRALISRVVARAAQRSRELGRADD